MDNYLERGVVESYFRSRTDYYVGRVRLFGAYLGCQVVVGLS